MFRIYSQALINREQMFGADVWSRWMMLVIISYSLLLPVDSPLQTVASTHSSRAPEPRQCRWLTRFRTMCSHANINEVWAVPWRASSCLLRTSDRLRPHTCQPTTTLALSLIKFKEVAYLKKESKLFLDELNMLICALKCRILMLEKKKKWVSLSPLVCRCHDGPMKCWVRNECASSPSCSCCTTTAAWWPWRPPTWPASWHSEKLLSSWRRCRGWRRTSPLFFLRSGHTNRCFTGNMSLTWLMSS